MAKFLVTYQDGFNNDVSATHEADEGFTTGGELVFVNDPDGPDGDLETVAIYAPGRWSRVVRLLDEPAAVN